MPKSKRERKSALTQVKKKGRAVKDALVSKIRDAIGAYSHIYVFDVANMKNAVMKNVREEWMGSRFFLGKNRVMQMALGRTPEDEQKEGLAKLAQTITGTRGLLFTDKSPAEVSDYFNKFSAQHYARAGFVCRHNYKLAAGTLPAERCPHPMEPMLRKLGLPTRLVQGKIELLSDVSVAARDDVLTPEQCKIMQLFGVKLATFKLHLLYAWHDGNVTEVEGEGGAEDEDAGEDDEQKGGDLADAIELRDAGGDDYETYQEEDGDDLAMEESKSDDDAM